MPQEKKEFEIISFGIEAHASRIQVQTSANEGFSTFADAPAFCALVAIQDSYSVDTLALKDRFQTTSPHWIYLVQPPVVNKISKINNNNAC